MQSFVRQVILLLTVVGLILLAIVSCTTNSPQSQELTQEAFISPGVYIITSKHSGLVIGIPDDNSQIGIQVRQYRHNNTISQLWRIENVEGEWIKISSHVNGYVFDAAAPRNGGSVSLQPYRDNVFSKHWKLIDRDGNYEIVNRASLGLLDVAGFSTQAGGIIHTWSRNKLSNQLWTFQRVADIPSNYQQNLQLITKASVRNRNLDNSSFRNTPMSKLPVGSTSPLLGPRSDYLQQAGGNPEEGFPFKDAGTFRTACEFSHFAYDDPLVHPNKPGAAHLHIFWGNTDVNAYSTYETLRDSGSSTCNGMELNRTGYWAPAMFDARGNVRIPERIIVYYKGYGLANGKAQVYPPRAAVIMNDKIHRTNNASGGAEGEMSFECTDQFRGGYKIRSLTIPVCGTNVSPWRRTLEMRVKFPNCWNGLDPSKPENWLLARYGSWFYSNCEYDGHKTFPNIEYLIAYPLEPGETTAGWYLSSDIDPTTRTRKKARGSSVHADWWGAWHPSINKRWIDNCVNLKQDFNGDGKDDVPHGCGFGYLSNGGPERELDASGDRIENRPIPPYPGPALKYRQQYTGPIKVAASTLYRELCPDGPPIVSATAAAYCRPPAMTTLGSLDSSYNSHNHP